MFILVYGDNEMLSTDNTVEAFGTREEAYAAMVGQLDCAASEEGVMLPDPIENGDLEETEDGKWVGVLDDDYAYLERDYEKWVIFEVPEVAKKPHPNPNVAETVRYECSKDPTFGSGEVLLHQATVRWNSGKTFEVHAPERVELRVGGTAYEYRAM